jgi:Tfp pilus assembly protein PilF
LYLALDQPAETLEAARRALALAPEYGEAHELIGLAHDARAEPEAAAQAYRRRSCASPGGYARVSDSRP